MIPRGFKNNNPGNIRHDGVEWKGEVTGTDKGFKTFSDMKWGVRAMFHMINNYRLLHGLNTIEKIVNRWAPPTENHTDKYVEFVSKRSFVPWNVTISTTNRDVMIPIVAAMIEMENGKRLPGEVIDEGWRLFLENKK